MDYECFQSISPKLTILVQRISELKQRKKIFLSINFEWLLIPFWGVSVVITKMKSIWNSERNSIFRRLCQIRSRFIVCPSIDILNAWIALCLTLNSEINVNLSQIKRPLSRDYEIQLYNIFVYLALSSVLIDFWIVDKTLLNS